MGRGRGKRKKQLLITTSRDDAESGEDEKLPVRRRGRPHKHWEDDVEEDDKLERIEEECDEDGHETKSNKSAKNQPLNENGKSKRKRASQINEIADSVKVENALGTKTNGTELIKSVGYRHIGSRRKNKPRRAAEVGFECNGRF